MARRVRAALGLGLGLILIGLAFVLLHHHERLAGSNDLGFATGAVVPAGRGVCQSRVRVPAGAGRLRLLVSTAGLLAGPVTVAVRDDHGRTIAVGHSEQAFRDAPVDLPLQPALGARDEAIVCLRNEGRVQVAFLGGQVDSADPRRARVPTRQPQPVAVNLDWYRTGQPAWAQVFPAIAERFGLVKATFLGTWTFWVVLGLVVLMGGATVALVLRETEG